MKNFISFCLLILLSATVHCQAQSSRAYKVAFNSAEAEGYVSDVFTIGEFPEAAFTSLSAYIMIPNATVTLEYRIKNKDGWEVWKNMSLNEEGETPDRTTFYAPYINEAFEAIQFRAGQALNEEVVFRLFFPSVSQNIEPKMKAANDSICNCQKPAFCGRDCWCPSGDCPKDSIPDYTTPTHIIIHHSAGSSVSNNWPAVVKAIWDFHVKTNGWSDVGYNWLIDPNGVIYEGRGDSVLGAHFSCMNSGTTGICMLGNFETAQPTFSMISSLSYLAAWESCTENIPPMDTRWHASSQLNLPSISSHRDANTSTAPNGCPKGTLCPGANLYVMLPTIRQAVDNNPCTGSLDIVEAWKEGFHIYPNPVKDKLEVHQDLQLAGKVKGVEVRNSAGQLLFSEILSFSELHETGVDVSNFPQGVYFLRLLTEEGPVNRTFIRN